MGVAISASLRSCTIPTSSGAVCDKFPLGFLSVSIFSLLPNRANPKSQSLILPLEDTTQLLDFRGGFIVCIAVRPEPLRPASHCDKPSRFYGAQHCEFVKEVPQLLFVGNLDSFCCCHFALHATCVQELTREHFSKCTATNLKRSTRFFSLAESMISEESTNSVTALIIPLASIGAAGTGLPTSRGWDTGEASIETESAVQGLLRAGEPKLREPGLIVGENGRRTGEVGAC
ncbi:hypothetical protein Pelo_10506 [Pelomyxa schiedti]|nr:hypothetical protein Pelo_10506 [Pelomyxa schiedti]